MKKNCNYVWIKNHIFLFFCMSIKTKICRDNAMHSNITGLEVFNTFNYRSPTNNILIDISGNGGCGSVEQTMICCFTRDFSRILDITSRSSFRLTWHKKINLFTTQEKLPIVPVLWSLHSLIIIIKQQQFPRIIPVTKFRTRKKNGNTSRCDKGAVYHQ